MALSVKPSGAALGAEIDFDLSRGMDERQFREIEAAFHDNIVVVFRSQTLSNERHIEFSRRFGELEIHIVKKYLLSDHPEILRISNIRDDNGELIGLADAGLTWHTDTSYLKRPSRCSLLHAKEVPVRDAHPIVRTHHATGRKGLYVTEGECIGIEGMPEEDGRPLISELHAHCIRPEFQYRHKWQVGDLLMWDNATSMHLAICDYQLPERRLMYRTTVAGGVPF